VIPEPSPRTGSDCGAIDCHAHVFPPALADLVVESQSRDPAVAAPAKRLTTTHPGAYPGLFGGIKERIALMDEAGIDCQLLSMGSPYVYPSDPGLRVELARTWNDEAFVIARDFPGRFGLLCSVPLPDVAASIAESRRVAEREHHAGFMMHTNVEGAGIDDPAWWPLYECWDEMSAVVLLHPDGFCVPGLLDDYSMNWDVGTQFDDVIAVIRLYSSGMPVRFPHVRWIVPHLGGALPFLLGRLDQHWERDKARRELAQAPSASLGRLLFDTAGHDAASIRFALSVLGPERVVFGSDYPMVNAKDLRPVGANILRACDDERQVRQVRRSNLAEALGSRVHDVLANPEA
jgi:predicted TIM-barrel fold metal-dependent hydrolase